MKTSKGRLTTALLTLGLICSAAVTSPVPVAAQAVPAPKSPRTLPLPPLIPAAQRREIPPGAEFAQTKPAQPTNPTPLISPLVPPAPAPPPITGLPFSNPLTTPPAPTVSDPTAIRWDAETKEYKATSSDTNALFTFWLTNTSPAEVLVNSVRTSCGCTVAQLPEQPWHIPPGGNGPIKVTVNLVGKSGQIAKGVTVDTSVGIKQLTVRVDIPAMNPSTSAGVSPAMFSGTMNDADRMKNMQMALADRQVVFKNAECAKCHADPAKGKTDGRLIYTAVCATCHNSHLRAAMVPDLRALKNPTDAAYWRQWISGGRPGASPGSMMPAFAESYGGPLNDQQVTALVDFMVKAFPNRTIPAATLPGAAGPARAPVPAPVQAPVISPTAKPAGQ